MNDTTIEPGGISVHAVDVSRGIPASGLSIKVTKLDELQTVIAHVKINIVPRETGLAISFLVERQETLEILRRHSEELLESLTEMEFEGASLDFNREETSDTEHRNDDKESLLPDEASSILDHRSQLTIESDRLDLRI